MMEWLQTSHRSTLVLQNNIHALYSDKVQHKIHTQIHKEYINNGS